MPSDASDSEVDLETDDTAAKPTTAHKPTPGPYYLGGNREIYAKLPNGVMRVVAFRPMFPDDIGEDYPNAQLLASSWELLDICETALSCGVLDARSGPATAEIIRRIYAVKTKLESEPCSNP